MTPEALDSLDKPELIALVLTLAEQNRILTEQVATLTARVAALEARLMIPPKTPGNSSLPPSKGEKANLPETPKNRIHTPQAALWRSPDIAPVDPC